MPALFSLDSFSNRSRRESRFVATLPFERSVRIAETRSPIEPRPHSLVDAIARENAAERVENGGVRIAHDTTASVPAGARAQGSRAIGLDRTAWRRDRGHRRRAARCHLSAPGPAPGVRHAIGLEQRLPVVCPLAQLAYEHRHGRGA